MLAAAASPDSASTFSMVNPTSRDTPVLDTCVAVRASGAAGQKNSVDTGQVLSVASLKKKPFEPLSTKLLLYCAPL